MIWRVIGAAVSLCLIVWGVLPLTAIRIHVGCAALIAVGVVGFVVCIRFRQVSALFHRLCESTVGRILVWLVGSIVIALVVLFIVVSVMMTVAATKQPQENATLVVLGAGLRDDRPSRILRGRLNATIEYLEAHPKAVCVVSGGQGDDEPCTEAAVMQRYLLDAGIAAERIYVEDRSTSTFENIQFSKQVIEENGLSDNVAIVTQEFHQYRAQQFARQAGFTEVSAITARTEFVFFAGYWIRDFAGICHMWILGR